MIHWILHNEDNAGTWLAPYDTDSPDQALIQARSENPSLPDIRLAYVPGVDVDVLAKYIDLMDGLTYEILKEHFQDSAGEVIFQERD